MKESNRVIANTIILYIKMFITVIISLISVRIVLANLGVVDYGIFNVLMGLIGMLSFLNSAMTVATQRFISFYRGKNDIKIIRKVFNNSLFLHLLISIIISLILEFIGIIAIYNWLTIPSDRINIALYVFQFMVISTFFTILTVPYTALINSYERMEFIAIISIIESVFKFIVAICLIYISCDKLLFYGFGIGLVYVISFLLYYAVCHNKFYDYSRLDIKDLNLKLIQDVGKFASWNLVGAITSMSKNQGLSVIFNIFQGPTVNAAFGIANQVSGQLSFFSSTMMKSINPQIMKAEGAGNRKIMLSLSTSSCKFSFMLLALFSIPCIVEMKNLLDIWLKETPEYTVIFCCCILIAMLFDQLSVGINSAFQAANFVKESSIYVGIVKLLIIPVGIVILYQQYSVYYVLIFYSLVELMSTFVRLILAKKLLNYNILEYLNAVVFKVMPPFIITFFISLACTQLLNAGLFRIIINFFFSFLSYSLLSYLFSLSKDERIHTVTLFIKLYHKYHDMFICKV